MAGSPSRKTMVVRVWESKDDGTTDTRWSWIDTSVLKSWVSHDGKGFQFQETQYTFNYFDPANPDAYDPVDPTHRNPNRDWDMLRIYSPHKTTWIDFPITKKIRTSQAKGFQEQKTVSTFDNTSGDDTRKVVTKKVKNLDVNARFDEHGQPPRDPQEYLDSLDHFIDNPNNKDQYVEVEVPSNWKSTEGTGFQYQGTVHTFDYDEDVLMRDPIIPDES